MNILLIHSDKLEYETKKATKLAEKIPDKLKHQKVRDSLVCFMSFEEDDNGKEKIVSENLVKEIVGVAEQVKEKQIVLYPYVHLLFGKKPSRPDTALNIMKLAEEKLKTKGFKIMRVPFGFYKAFEIKCKGHPLSELSREVKAVGSAQEEISEALKKEETLKSNWYVLEPNGKLHEIKNVNGKIQGYNFKKQPNLEKFALYEISKARKADIEPPHVKLMKQLGIADYEPASDPGNLRYPPKGKMMKALVEQWTTQNILDYGAMEIESPIMFDYNHPSLKSYLDRFPARQYAIETPNKRVFLRFAACFGQFLMMHDAQLSYRDMPVRMYELTKYSFRVEKRGELTGLRRLRAFTMPDTHAFCADLKQTKEEMLKRFDLSWRVQQGFGLKMPQELECAIRVIKPFFDENKDFVVKLAKKFKKPVLLEMWDKQFFYFVLKYDWNFVDALGKASALTTDQIDVENAERYDINFVDKDNKRKKPFILHCSPSGATERVLYALLEKSFLKEKKGKPPVFPLWLSPSQVRFCPVNDQLTKYCLKLADDLAKDNVRVDVDDRSESIGRKVRDAELEWVPLIVVVGDKEKKSGKFPVRFKETGKIEKMTLKQLIKKVKTETEGKPFRPLPLPQLISQRPVFSSA